MSQQKSPTKPISCLWCFHSSNWKREEILDHSFSLINVNDYVNNSITMRIKYLWIFFYVFKTILVYLSDLYLLINSYNPKKENIETMKKCKEAIGVYNNGTMNYYIPNKWNIEKICDLTDNSYVKGLLGDGESNKGYIFWLLLFSISITYLLSYLEWEKAKKIIKSQDISFAFTNLVAYRYYCIKSYAYYCFFQLIQDHTKRSDDIAFFVFFTFKGWKRFVFADSPRRILNIVIFVRSLINLSPSEKSFLENMVDDKNNIKSDTIQLFTSSFILLSWIFTGIRLLCALIVYVPLLSIIQGNLKEYCCHNIDKRIGDIINSKTKQKIKKIQKVEKAKLEAARKLGVNPNQLHLDESAIKKGFDIEILPDPTLPKIDVDLNDVGTGNQQNNNYYNPPYNNQYNNHYNNNNPYNTQYTMSNPQYPGSTVAYSDYSDSLNRPTYPNDHGSNVSDSGSRNGSLPYNARNVYNQQPKPQYMNSPYNGPSKGTIQSKGTQQWNTPPPQFPPSRSQQGWNDQMSNASSNYSNNPYRRNGNHQSYDTISINSEEPLLQPPPRKIYR
ncbi:hypothetical protein H8356DRAFT_1062372 [Neocallimastix lanati (nom. inval.)]|uniref:Vacuolar membrane protein n=1 Tax=Neocallimastix californiae TaxID=1754190 RepID=A0A1Y2DBY2_9FUNG|nr:hypothetical protein H8356DRAFT_1062372 [Neocallimastix sp. JGI-2020a]ORY56768.1 hypothetical protein LY90DRAFT_669325 [Neocallimastix californiae]|eukprot:ORY56768.1 hypothetical protein LY90DRAFT_669325 [Neocallimastix californiae]